MKIATKALKDTVGAASAMGASELTVEPSERGWSVQIMSPSRTHVMTLDIPAERFEGYVQGKRFAVGTERLAKVLASCGAETDIEVGDRVRVSSAGMRMTLPLIEAEETQRMNELEGFTSFVTVPIEVIRRMSDAAPDKAMAVTIKVGETGMSLESMGDDGVNQTSLDVTADECIVCDGESEAMYAWSMLREFLKATPRGMDVSLQMARNYPMKATFETEEGVRGAFVLAPWIEEE